MSDYTGRQLGNYQLTRLLGEGAFAQVYLGEHIYLSTQAAIKVLKTQTENYPVDLFYTEARNIARLVHPNIVRVLDFGVDSNTPFLVLDYAPNGTLRQRYVPGTVLPLSTIVSYIKQIAEALQYAHDDKLVHRDIKPENILLGRRNEVLLSDFGIALMVQTMQYQNLQDVAGTLPYMAPEQIQGQPRPASDQYSLGIIAYEWLSGRRPFQGSMTEMISQHLAVAPPSLRSIIPAITPDVEHVVMTALEKDPGQRFGSVRAFAVALEQASQFSEQGGKSVLASAPTAPIPSLKKPATPPPISLRAPASMAQSAPAGTVIGGYHGHLNTVRSLSWSPDNASIVSVSDDRLVHVWDALTGERRQIYQDIANIVHAAAWSFDGSRIATVGNDAHVRIWDFATGRLLATYRGHTGSAINALAWSPAHHIIATAASDGVVHVWDATTGQPLTIYRGHTGSVNALAWSPYEISTPYGRGYHIVSGGDDVSIQTWEAATGRGIALYRSQPARVLSVGWSPNIYSSSSRFEPATSMYNSSRVACGREDGMVEMWDTSVNREVLSYRYLSAVTTVGWSPDGRRFAYASHESAVEVWDTTTNLKLVTFSHTAPQRVLAWSPNGKYIASGGGDSEILIWVAP
ncbi:serine/threonine-protein kinase [Dictyobacter kobayashii]|uniref:Protein kinase domain-containing protein n=1 Tax=Dictyobacter kobayashii TaxID=2014872 RepID=A0A402AT65_9CHLR|nr:serine/threonine-protein kinase [Dictyobacter kobayashii]GCE22308.1 hypothetical protein KDK_61080 [Dictyobacter kobayashii]